MDVGGHWALAGPVRKANGGGRASEAGLGLTPWCFEGKSLEGKGQRGSPRPCFSSSYKNYWIGINAGCLGLLPLLTGEWVQYRNILAITEGRPNLQAS